MIGLTHAWDWTLWFEITTAVLVAVVAYLVLVKVLR